MPLKAAMGLEEKIKKLKDRKRVFEENDIILDISDDEVGDGYGVKVRKANEFFDSIIESVRICRNA